LAAYLSEPRGAELVLGQRIGNAGAQHIGASASVSGSKLFHRSP
jgi:hypothetical protein